MDRSCRVAHLASAALVVTLLVAGCGGSGSGDDVAEDDAEAPSDDSASTAPPSSAELATTTMPPVTGPESAGCSGGITPVTAMETTEEIWVLDGARTYQQYVPTSYDPSTPTPVVIDLHGFVTGAVMHSRLTELNVTAERQGFIAVTPDGMGPPSGLEDGNDLPVWNVGGSGLLPNDRGFVMGTLDEVEAQLCIDLDRVYVVGLSNGGHLASTLVCDHADRIAAVAAVAGFLVPDECEPSRPVPLLAIHGTDDEYVGFEGGLGEGIEQINPPDAFYDARDDAYDGVRVRPITQAAGAWAERNGCRAEPEVSEVSDEVELTSWNDCATVQLFVVAGGGQSWPGSPLFEAVEATSGYTTMDIDANQVIWGFFESHPKP